MTPTPASAEAAPELAALHAQAFDHPWSAAEICGLLARPEVFALAADEGFVLMQAAAGEAEVLTLAVAPAARRRGLGRALVEAALAEARRRGAEAAFLEVAEGNAAARALYAGCGFTEAGRRRGYYRRAGGAREDALVLRCDLNSPSP